MALSKAYTNSVGATTNYHRIDSVTRQTTSKVRCVIKSYASAAYREKEKRYEYLAYRQPDNSNTIITINSIPDADRTDAQKAALVQAMAEITEWQTLLNGTTGQWYISTEEELVEIAQTASDSSDISWSGCYEYITANTSSNFYKSDKC